MQKALARDLIYNVCHAPFANLLPKTSWQAQMGTATAWLKKVQERLTATGVPEGMARAEEPTISRAHILNHATYCSLGARDGGFHLTQPQNSRNSLKTTDCLILVLYVTRALHWKAPQYMVKPHSEIATQALPFFWSPLKTFNGWSKSLSHRIGGDKSKTHMQRNPILSTTDIL